METKTSSLIPCLIALALLAGCAGSEYKAKSLATLPQEHTLISSDASVSGSYTVLNAKACNTYLGRNVLAKGYQPICITIANNTMYPLRFDLDQFSLPTAAAHEVAKAVHFNTAGRAAGLGIPGTIFATGAVGYSVLAACFLANHIALLFGIFVSAGVLVGAIALSPAVASSAHAAKFNKNIDENFAAKSLTHHTIAPHETITGLVFVPKKDWNKSFSVTLTGALAKDVVLHS